MRAIVVLAIIGLSLIGTCCNFQILRAAFAQAPVVLTPTKLYDLIEAQQKVGLNQGMRLRMLMYRVCELERKVAGMQKQITILHAKSRAHAAEIQYLDRTDTGAASDLMIKRGDK